MPDSLSNHGYDAKITALGKIKTQNSVAKSGYFNPASGLAQRVYGMAQVVSGYASRKGQVIISLHTDAKTQIPGTRISYLA